MTNISIVLPVYNAEKTIKKTIESIINQVYKKWELIIVNDGSTDNSKNICDEYAKQDKRIKVYHVQNGGPSRARNTALNKCMGKYIMFIDSDDLYDKDMIKIMEEEINSNELDLVCCNYVKSEDSKIDTGKNVEEKVVEEKKDLYKLIEYMQEKYLYNVIWNKIYKYDIIKENNIVFDEEIDMGEDYSFNNKYFQYVEKAKLINNKLYIHLIDKKSISSKYRANEFERRIKNISSNEELYIKNNYPMRSIYIKYIQAIIGSVETILSSKSNLTVREQLEKTKYYIEFPKIKEVIEKSKENKNIYYILIRGHHYKMLYLAVYLRTKIKKIIYCIKGMSYRR